MKVFLRLSLLSVSVAACTTTAPIMPTQDLSPAPVIMLPPSGDIIVDVAPPKPDPVIIKVPVVPVPPKVVTKPAVLSAAEGRALVARLLPSKIRDRQGWGDDIFNAMSALKIAYTADNVCAILGVIEQESSWQADPVVPNLDKIVWDKIAERSNKYLIPLSVVKIALAKKSPDGRSYTQRIDSLRTEKEMNALYQDLSAEARNIGLPIEMKNPIRTGGPMQVSVEFAQGHVKAWPYPYKMSGSIRDEVFTRRGGVYFGIANVMQYPASYSKMLYRFADFNAGRYASRNAAVQKIVSRLTNQQLVVDGDLLNYDANGVAQSSPSNSAKAILSLAARLGLSASQIMSDLKQEKYSSFAQTPTYIALYRLAGAGASKEAMPQIDLKSPKITRKLTTEWFAKRVEWRYETCLARK